MKKVIKKEIISLLKDNDNRYNLKKLRKCIHKNVSNNDSDADDDTINKNFALAIDSLLEKDKILIVKDDVVINDSSNSNDNIKKKKRSNTDDNDNNDNNNSNDIKKLKTNSNDNNDDDNLSDDEIKTRKYASDKINNNDSSSNNVKGDTTILLFYAYCDPQMTRSAQDAAIAFCYKTLKDNEVTGRLRIGREGFNGKYLSNSSINNFIIF